MLPKTDRLCRSLESLSTGSSASTLSLLAGLLFPAVAQILPFVRQECWKERQDRIDRILKRWHERGQDCFSEALLYRAKKGESRQEFCDLAEVIAVMAFCPGGIRIFGMHWEEVDER